MCTCKTYIFSSEYSLRVARVFVRILYICEYVQSSPEVGYTLPIPTRTSIALNASIRGTGRSLQVHSSDRLLIPTARYR